MIVLTRHGNKNIRGFTENIRGFSPLSPPLALPLVIDNTFNNLYIKKLCRTTLLPKCKPFWNSLYDQIEWKEVWKLPSKYCLTNKVKEVTYKVIHLIYPVKQVVAIFLETWRPHISFVTWRRNP